MNLIPQTMKKIQLVLIALTVSSTILAKAWRVSKTWKKLITCMFLMITAVAFIKAEVINKNPKTVGTDNQIDSISKQPAQKPNIII